MEPEELKKKAMENKAATVGVVVLAIFVLGAGSLFFSFLNSGLGMSSQADYQRLDRQQDLEADAGASSGFVPPTGDEEVSGSYVEVQEGDVEINSKNIEQDISSIRSITGEFKGYVEESSKREGSLYTNADLTVRVPSDSFQDFIDRVNQEFEVESYDVENYRISTQRELDELTILNRSMDDYENIRNQIKKMDNDKDKLNLLMDITDKELELQEKRKRYQRDLSDKEQRGDLATVDLSLKEKRKVDIWPDNIGNQIKNEVKDMLDTVVDTLIKTFTGGVQIFFKTVQYLVYLAIIAVPAAFGYRIGRSLYQKLF